MTRFEHIATLQALVQQAIFWLYCPTMKPATTLSAVVASLAMAVTSHSAIVVTNGSFETFTGTSTAAPYGVVSGWTYAGTPLLDGLLGAISESLANFPDTPHGSNWLLVDGRSFGQHIYQAVGTINLGQQLTLSALIGRQQNVDLSDFELVLYRSDGNSGTPDVLLTRIVRNDVPALAPQGSTMMSANYTTLAADEGETLFVRIGALSNDNPTLQTIIDNVVIESVGSEPAPRLTITQATPPETGFDLEWDSIEGKLYHLRTSTDLAGPIAAWEILESDIIATPPANVKNVPADGPRRFYAVEEFDAPPPPPLLSADFESNNGGFTTTVDAGTAWEWGTPASTGLGGTVNSGNGGSTNCWGTNNGNPGFYADPTTNSRLISPNLDLTSVAAAELTFAHAIDIPNSDTAVVRVFDVDTNLEIVAGAFPLTVVDANQSSAAWADSGPHSLPVGATIRIEWILTGTGGDDDDYMGWYVDDVTVVEASP